MTVPIHLEAAEIQEPILGVLAVYNGKIYIIIKIDLDANGEQTLEIEWGPTFTTTFTLDFSDVNFINCEDYAGNLTPMDPVAMANEFDEAEFRANLAAAGYTQAEIENIIKMNIYSFEMEIGKGLTIDSQVGSNIKLGGYLHEINDTENRLTYGAGKGYYAIVSISVPSHLSYVDGDRIKDGDLVQDGEILFILRFFEGQNERSFTVSWTDDYSVAYKIDMTDVYFRSLKVVEFYSHDDDLLYTYEILENSNLSTLPDAPERFGYDFLGWYDEDDKKLTTMSIITNDIKVTAVYEKIETITVYNELELKNALDDDLFERILFGANIELSENLDVDRKGFYLSTEEFELEMSGKTITFLATTDDEDYVIEGKFKNGTIVINNPKGHFDLTGFEGNSVDVEVISSRSSTVIFRGHWNNIHIHAGTYAIIEGDAEIAKLTVSGIVLIMDGADIDELVVNAGAEIYYNVLETYTVSFETDGGSPIESQLVNAGNTATQPADPTKEFAIFAGWFTTEAHTEAFDFGQPIDKDLTIYAKWDEAKVHNETQDTYYKTINEAIASANPEDIILVSAGLYEEVVVIDKALTIQSLEGAEHTIIDAGGASYAVQYGQAGIGLVKFRGFTVQGWTTGGINQPMGNGGADSAFHVLYNRVLAPSLSPQHGNSIQVSGDGSEVMYNEVTVSTLEGEDYNASGILVVNASNVKIRFNTIEGGDAAISVQGGKFGSPTRPTNEVEIFDNTISNSHTGLSVEYNSTNVSVVQNKFTKIFFGAKTLSDETGTPDLNLGDVLGDNDFPIGFGIHDNLIVQIEVVVGNEKELRQALDNEYIRTIKIGKDIILNHSTLTISRDDVTIEGNNYIISFENKPGWQGDYIFLIDGVDHAVITKLELIGGDIAILINNSTDVVIKGLTLSGQEFGGIKLTELEEVQSVFVSHSTYLLLEDLPVIWTEGFDASSYTFADLVRFEYSDNETWFVKLSQIVEVKFIIEDEVVYLTKELIKGMELSEPTDPEKDGYEFLGWYLDLEGEPYEFNNPVLANITLHAKWKAINYQIVYHLDGGTNHNDNPLFYTIEDEVALLTPTKEGYNFVGWFDALEGGNKVSEIPIGSMGEKVLYARWEANTYVVLFDSNEGEAAAPLSIQVTYDSEYGTLATTTRAGYEFKGWYLDKELTSLVTEETIVKTAEDHTLYAKWEVIEYTITYHLDGGVVLGEQNPTTYTIESEQISLRSASKEPFRFMGWFLEEDFSGYKIHIINPELFLDDIVLYARFAILHKITIGVGKGGEGIYNADFDIEDGEKIPVRGAHNALDGYEFDNWYKNDEVVPYDFDEPVTESFTLNARFNVIEYTISYDLVGGENHPDNPSIYTVETETITLKDPTKDWHNFIGWFDKLEGGNQVTTIPEGSIGDVKLYARWEETDVYNETLKFGYHTIQAALDAARDGDTILVAPGTYEESIVINNSIVLKSSEGRDVTIIDGGGAVHAVSIGSNNLGDVTFEGFTVQNWVEGGISQSMANGGANSAFHVLNNKVFAPATAESHGNSIQVSGDGSVVAGNRVYVAAYATDEYAVSGILVVNAINVRVEENDISGADAAISVQGSVHGEPPLPSKNVTILKNKIHDIEIGILVSGEVSEVSVIANTFTDIIIGVQIDNSYGYKPEIDLEEILNDPQNVFPDGFGIRNDEIRLIEIYVGTRKELVNALNIEYILRIYFTNDIILDDDINITIPGFTLNTETHILDLGGKTITFAQTDEQEDYFLIGTFMNGTIIIDNTNGHYDLTGLEGNNVDVQIINSRDGTVIFRGHWGDVGIEDTNGYTILAPNADVGNISVGQGSSLLIMDDSNHGDLLLDDGSNVYYNEIGKYSVSFISNGGSEVESQSVNHGNKVLEPTDPTREDYQFMGWYKEESLTNMWYFATDVVTSDITLYAKWELITEVDVISEAELLAALANPNIRIINLKASMTLESPKVLINRDNITINGNNHILALPNADGWQGHYVLHIYNAEGIVINDLELNGGDAGILVNASKVTLNNVFLAVHEFGGIELSMGLGMTRVPELIVTGLDSNILPSLPIIWTDELAKPTNYVFPGLVRFDYNEAQDWYVKEDQIVTVTFNIDGVESTQSLINGHKVIQPADPEKAGYEFIEWQLNGEPFDFDTKVIANLTLIAKWEVIEYDITYYLDDGENHENNPAKYNIETETIILEEPYKEGYNFLGWYDTNDELVVSIEIGSFGDVELFARWEIKKYTIRFLNEGEVLLQSDLVEYGELPEYRGATPTKPMTLEQIFTFNVWAPAIKAVTGDQDYVATYSAVDRTYTITFDSNGGSEVPPMTRFYGVELTPPDNPVKEGYEFVGWFSDEELLNAYTFTVMPTQDITLYAKWEEIISGIEYNDGVSIIYNFSTQTATGTTLSNTTLQDILEHEYLVEVTDVSTIYNGNGTGGGFYENTSGMLKLGSTNNNGKFKIILEDEIRISQVVFYIEGWDNTDVIKVNGHESDLSRTDNFGNYLLVELAIPTNVIEIEIIKRGFMFALELHGSEVIVQEREVFRVTFDYNNESITNYYEDVREGFRVTKPENPVIDGFEFEGWFLNLADEKSFNFNMPIESDLTLIAKWKEIDEDANYSGVYETTFSKVGDTKEVDSSVFAINPEGIFTLTSIKNSGSDITKYFNSGTAVRFYPGSGNGSSLKVELDEDYIIESVEFIYPSSGQTAGNVTIKSGSAILLDNVSKPEGKTYTFANYPGVDLNSFIVQNTSPESSGSANQFRLQQIKITIAKVSELTEQEKLNAAKNSLVIGYSGSDNSNSVTTNLTLPTIGLFDSIITWQSSEENVINNAGLVERPNNNTEVDLVATISLNGLEEEKVFTVTVIAKPAQANSYTEDFENRSLTALYADFLFNGDGGSKWEGKGRNEGDYAIDKKGVMLQRGSDGYIKITLYNGLSDFSFDFRKAFTGSTTRTISIQINNETAKTFTVDSGSDEDSTVKNVSLLGLNYTGIVTIYIKPNISGNHQITFDNFAWTEYLG